MRKLKKLATASYQSNANGQTKIIYVQNTLLKCLLTAKKAKSKEVLLKTF